MAAYGPIASGMWGPEVGQGAWWCLVWVDIPYPSGRSPWTSGTVRGQKRGGGCCRPSVLPPSGRTRPRRVPTASRSTFPKPRLDSEQKTEVSPFHLATHPHPCKTDLHTNLRPFLSPVLDPPAGHCYLILYRLLSISISTLTTTPNSVHLLIKQAMTAILVS